MVPVWNLVKETKKIPQGIAKIFAYAIDLDTTGTTNGPDTF
jgi:hypothetical protein